MPPALSPAPGALVVRPATVQAIPSPGREPRPVERPAPSQQPEPGTDRRAGEVSRTGRGTRSAEAIELRIGTIELHVAPPPVPTTAAEPRIEAQPIGFDAYAALR
jgi:hypothetical protein